MRRSPDAGSPGRAGKAALPEGAPVTRRLEIGVCLTNYGDVTSPEASIGTGRLAEELGYDSVWVSDHILVPPAFGSVFGREFLDPFVCLAYAAAETTRVKLGTTVVVAPLRSPFAQAKMLSTLDYLSGGRVVFGAGVGWDEEEFVALGVPFAERGRMTEEYLAIMRELWTSAAPAFEGRYHRFAGAAFEPKPVQRPIPIWMGGHAGPVLRRTARIAQAWHASEIPVSEVAGKYEYLEKLRTPPPALTYRMYLRPTDIAPAPMRSPAPTFEGDRKQIVEYVRSYLDPLPIEHLVVEFVVSNAGDLRNAFRYLAEEVVPELGRKQPGEGPLRRRGASQAAATGMAAGPGAIRAARPPDPRE